MKAGGVWVALLGLGALGGCLTTEADTNCANDVGLVGLDTFQSKTIQPGTTVLVQTFTAVCNGQCPVTSQRWMATPIGSADSQQLDVYYGVNCGSGAAPDWHDIGNCGLQFHGSTALTDGDLATSHSPTCVGIWAEVNATDPSNTAPCGKGSSKNFAPVLGFTNDSSVPVVITGPGPDDNPTASCTYVPTP